MNAPTTGSSRMREFKVTILTTRCGTSTVVIAAVDRDAAFDAVREEVSGGDCIVPPEQCTDDVQAEILSVRPVAPSFGAPV